MSTKKKLSIQIQNDFAKLKATQQLTKMVYANLIKAIDIAQQQTITQIEKKYTTTNRQVQSDFDQIRQQSITKLRSAIDKGCPTVTSWGDGGWRNYNPPKNALPPSLLRLGELQPTKINTALPAIPALLPFVGYRNVLVSFDKSQIKAGGQILENLAWRIVTLSTPGTYRLIILDPLGRGTNLSSLLKLPQDIRGSKIYGQQDEIEEVLQSLMTEIEIINQQRLLNTYKSIEDYNAANPNVMVPYQFLVFIGFPKGFSVKAADLLYSIARTGRRAGCYILGGVIRGEKLPHDFDFSMFMATATYLSLKNNDHLDWNDPEFENIFVKPDQLISKGLIDQLVRTITPMVRASASIGIPFKQFAVRKANWWHQSSQHGLTVPIGISESGSVYKLEIGQNGGYHMLVGGTTGSGKTNFLHLLVLMLSTTYSPEELALYLVDFKEGVEFQDYATYRLPHAHAVVLETEREFGLSVLQHLIAEMEHRGEIFKQAGVNDIQTYRERTSQKMSRVLLIMDEYVLLFEEDDQLSFRASEALSDLVKRGRSFGIHILLCAQRPASTFFSMNDIKSQMGLRVAFKCRPDDSALILGEGNEKAARLSRVGSACVTADPDIIDATSQVRIIEVPTDDKTLYLRGIQHFMGLKSFQRKTPLITFSRNAPAVWVQSRSIIPLLSTANRPLPVEPSFWLGQPLQIADDISIVLPAQMGSNLLILGSDETLALGLLLSSIQGLSLTTGSKTAQFVVFGQVDTNSRASQLIQSLKTNIPHKLEHYERQSAVEHLNTIMEKMEQRLNQDPIQANPRIFVFIHGLQRWLEARGPNAYTPSDVGEQLVQLCQLGPTVGIHSFLWIDRLDAINATVGSSVRDNIIAQFTHKVALQTNADESLNFLGNAAAAKLGRQRAYYRNEQWSMDIMQKFKPYALLKPPEEDVFLKAMQTHP